MNGNGDRHGLEVRLERLEAQNRRMKALAAAGVAALAAALLLGQAAPAGEVIEGREIILRDDTGKARVVLSAADTGQPLIALTDDTGKIRAGLTMKKGGPGLFLRNADGVEELRVALDSAGPAVMLSENQVARTGLAMIDGRPGLFLRDADKKQRLALTMQDMGPALFLMDRNENTRLGLLINRAGEPNLLVQDALGRAKMALGVSRRGAGLAIFDRFGELIYARPQDYSPAVD
jgi:hypothetical protein